LIAETFVRLSAGLHRTHRDAMAGLVSRLFAKLGRKPSSEPKDLADILMALTTGLSLQGTSEAVLLVPGVDRLEI
jgi:hypothetical protein